MRNLYLLVTSYLCFTCVVSVSRAEELTNENVLNEIIDDSNPLILTPLINEGRIKDAQIAAKVSRFQQFDNIESYSGFLQIDEKFDSNLFFWFFPSKRDYSSDPVILWLQGGPGSSSLNGVFFEHGPFELTVDNTLRLREHTWINNHSVIYLDSPVGTGFSFTKKNGYAENQTIIGNGVCKALIQFFELFPKLRQNDFFIIGESYAGKYIPAVARAIHHNNIEANKKINLKGFAIGGGIYEPKIQFHYADVLYQVGLIDFNVKEEMLNLEGKIVEFIDKKQWAKGFHTWRGILNLFKEATGYVSMYNYLQPNQLLYDYGLLTKYMNTKDIKSFLHAGDTEFTAQSLTAHSFLWSDITQSIAPWLAELLNHYRVLLYNGQLDTMIVYSSLVDFLKQLKFTGAEEYKMAKRQRWYVGEELAGYVKQAGNLTEVLVRNAGHSIPSDQPVWTLDLITRFTTNKPLYN